MQALAGYWATTHDWRRVEARLNTLPQYLTEIDGLELHFLHIRSQHEDALPLIVTHGWPGRSSSSSSSSAPHQPHPPRRDGGGCLCCGDPSLPGHRFSAKATTTGWDPTRTARALATLMAASAMTAMWPRAATGAPR